MRLSMEEKMPGYFCLFAFALQLPYLYIYLFYQQPEGQILENILNQLAFTFNPEEKHFAQFVLYAASHLALLVCSFLFLATRFHLLAMTIAAINVSVVLVFISWSQAVPAALPLLFARNLLRRK